MRNGRGYLLGRFRFCASDIARSAGTGFERCGHGFSSRCALGLVKLIDHRRRDRNERGSSLVGSLSREGPEQRESRGRSQSAPGSESLRHSRRLVAAVHHAVLALGIAALSAVGAPIGRLEQFLIRAAVALLQQVARALPAEDVVRRVAPGRALEVPIPFEELQEQRRLIEHPAAVWAEPACGETARPFDCGAGNAPGRAPFRRDSRARSSSLRRRDRSGCRTSPAFAGDGPC